MPPRTRRRAVGPPGTRPSQQEPRDLLPEHARDEAPAHGPADDDERLRADRPPHHDRGV